MRGQLACPMDKLPQTATADLLDIVLRRYERASTVLTSNRPGLKLPFYGDGTMPTRRLYRAIRGAAPGAQGPVQFSVGFSTCSTTRNSTGPFAASNRKPSCLGSAVNISEQSALTGTGVPSGVRGCDQPSGRYRRFTSYRAGRPVWSITPRSILRDKMKAKYCMVSLWPFSAKQMPPSLSLAICGPIGG